MLPISSKTFALVATLLPSVLCLSPRPHFFLSRALWVEPMDFVQTVHEDSKPALLNGQPSQSDLHAMDSNYYAMHNFSTAASSDDYAHSSTGHSPTFDEKIILDLLSTNFTLPLGSDKGLVWLSEGTFKSPLENSESTKNDVTVPAKYSKAVTLCDKTLAITDYIDESSESRTLIKCELFDLEKNPDKAYSEAQKTGIPTQTIDFSSMRAIINSCRQISEISPEISSAIISDEASLPSNTTETGSKLSMWRSWGGLVPGTKWCGLGDSAKNYLDLGKRRDVDVCCRAHDHCPIRLKALRSGYGLLNLSLYTKSHCDCDEDFMRCLRQVNNNLSQMLGNFYFNIMKVQCIKEEKALVCKEYRKSLNGKDECVRYESDKNSTKMIMTQPEVIY